MQKVSYMGNGSTTEFTFNFPYFENSNIIVTKNNIAATGYTIVGTSAAPDADIPYTGGKVVFDVAPTSLDNITIARQLPLTRIVDYQPTSKLEPTTLNQDANYLMEVIKDLQDEFDTLYSQYSDIADKESTATLLARIEAVNEQIHDFETEIENGRIMSRDDFYSYTANCITNIPQDIQLELNSGTLKLKSGSKITAPNGTTKKTTSDQTCTLTTDGTYLVFSAISNGSFQSDTTCTVSQCGSGATLPADGTTYKKFLNTTDNKIYRWTANGWLEWEVTLPIAVITVSSGAISSIDQVFNGFGYMGSTIFALPGVKGLVPDGRNSDGTLKNTEFTVSGILTQTLSGGNFSARNIILNSTTVAFSASATYDATSNTLSAGAYAIVGTGSATSGAISNLATKNVVCFDDANS